MSEGFQPKLVPSITAVWASHYLSCVQTVEDVRINFFGVTDQHKARTDVCSQLEQVWICI